MFLLCSGIRRIDPDLCETIAYALWRTPWRTRLDGLDACRMAAQDLAKHLQRAGYQIDRKPPLEPHGELARPRDEQAES